MIVIFWIDHWSDVPTSHHEIWKTSELTQVLQRMQTLRAQAHISHVTYSCENENCVGEPGVAETDSTYDWKKRR